MNALRVPVRAALLGALALLPGAAAAQPADLPASQVLAPRPYQPPASAGPVTLADAVRQTLLNSPALIAETYGTDRAAGLARETRGPFDTNLFAAPAVGFVKEPIHPALRKREIDKRRLLFIVADAFTELYRSMRFITENTSTDPPPCPLGIDLELPFQPLDRIEDEERAVLGTETELISPPLVELNIQIAGIDLSEICTRDISGGIGAEILESYWRQIDFSGGLGINGILDSAQQIRREAFRHLTEITESIAGRVRLNHERLGPLPDVTLRREFSFEAAISRAFRNGIFMDASLRLHSEEHGYGDKHMDPSHGGQDLPPAFPSEARFELVMPLSRGRGSVSVAAQERAAAAGVDAQQARVRHTAATQTFRTVIAYLNLVGAQSTLALLEESRTRQQALAGVADKRVAAGDLIQNDANRVRIRLASTAAAESRARMTVTLARVALAEAMGASVSRLADAPIASDGFTTTLPAIDGAFDAELAVARRRDVQAIDRAVAASAALAAGARADLRRRFDLSLSGGMGNRYESPLHRFLPDEQDPISSDFTPRPDRDSPARYYQPRGFGRSLIGRWEPFVAASFTIDFPFGNNAAKGRLAQAEAAERESRVQAAELRRAIGANVASIRGELQATTDALARLQDAVTNGEAAVASDVGRLQAGDVTVFDSLVTEEQLTNDKLALVRQRQLYLSTLARLKYETGEMLTFENENTPAERLRFSGSDFVVP
jgi:outer membrane protein TolC